MTKRLFGSAIALAAVASLSIAAAGSAQAAKTMKLGFALAKNTPYDTYAEVFKKDIEARTKGAVKVRNFCCFKMGGEQEMFKKLQLGTLDATIIAQNNAGPFFPKIDLLVLPYMLQNLKHGLKVVDGPVGQMIWKDMAKDTGVHLVAITFVSFRHIYNSKKPINTIADFGPLKYRVPKNVVMVDTYKAFGSDPVPLAWSETLTAVQTGTVDGGDLPIDVIYSQKFHEVAKNIAMTGHFALTPPFFVSDKFMSKLTADEKAAVYASAKVAGLAARKQVAEKEASIIETLKSKHGVKFTSPDTKPFIAAAAKVHAAFAKKRGGDYTKLIEAINAAAK